MRLEKFFGNMAFGEQMGDVFGVSEFGVLSAEV